MNISIESLYFPLPRAEHDLDACSWNLRALDRDRGARGPAGQRVADRLDQSGNGGGLGEGSVIADRFRRLTRESTWRKADEVRLNFRTYHPQGMAVVGDRFFLSSVQGGRSRGRAGEWDTFSKSMFGGICCARRGWARDRCITRAGSISTAERIWVPVAEYRPESRTVVYGVDPRSLEIKRVFEFRDHLGALVCDEARRGLVGVSWGSRRFYRWDLREDGELPVQARRPSSGTTAVTTWITRMGNS